MAIVGLRNLCTPDLLYLAISTIAIIVMIFQNWGFSQTYCLGNFTCDVPNTTLIFIIKIIYVLFWTWVLNLMCKSGATSVAWFLVLLPFILFFVLLSLMMI